MSAVPPAVPPSVPPPAGPNPVIPPRRNVVGIIALVIGILAALTPIGFVIGAFAATGTTLRGDDLSGFSALVYLAIGLAIGFFVGIPAVVLGFVSLLIKNAKRAMGIIGLVLGIIAMCAGFVPLFAFVSSGGINGGS